MVDLTRQLEDNMFSYMTYVPDRCSNMDVVRLPQAWLIDGGVPSSTFNFICHTRLPARSLTPTELQTLGEQRTPGAQRTPFCTLTHETKQLIDEAVDYFLDKGLPFGWWTGPSCEPADVSNLLVSAGLTPGGTYPGMFIDLNLLADTRAARGTPETDELGTIRQVTDEESLSDFARVAGTVFDGDDAAALTYYTSAAEVLLQPGCPFRMYTVYQNDGPVACCISFTEGVVVGVYSVATLAKARKLGFGRRLTNHALYEGLRLGARFGTLQSSRQGLRMYQAIGFEHFVDFRVWLPTQK